ncbi:hypothetical protein [Cyclobacterium qasimii]|uniref:Uncharacterized protein n=1 Tax=Cyclobacterium qasimii M12-11B TaxID=641524 RepID=S7V671_9BACT|nr:hypothetical protein [Cyclobacterium qasimii]EPR65680.1 hypothetical protein ADICYQ_5315 [Cyclobacterium qasimii M12-11B]
MIFISMFVDAVALAHQSSLSTTLFSGTENGEVIIQIISSMTASK